MSVETHTPPTNVSIEPSWRVALDGEFDKSYMKALKAFLVSEREKRKVIYPRASLFFEAFNQTPFSEVKVVILGQDPYHGPGQAHGLSFSVAEGVRPPPSLQNIFKELSTDLNIKIPKSGCLTKWAKQGVLLLNATLSVEANRAGSHQKKGWEEFTDQVIAKLSSQRQGIAFVLWGSYAHRKGEHIDTKKHFVLKSVHPSPLAAHRGFFGSRPFSQINNYLLSQGSTPIDWSLTDD